MVKDHGASVSTDTKGSGEMVYSQERMDKVLAAFTRAYKDNVAPFQGDLENELYKAILGAFREF
jgi:hypothetical protein